MKRLDHFIEVTHFEPNFGTEFAYTLAIAVVATALTIATAYPAAFRLARARPGSVLGSVRGLLLLAIIPTIAYGLPLTGVERLLGLYGSPLGLVLGATAAQLPLALWLLWGYLARLPRSLELI